VDERGGTAAVLVETLVKSIVDRRGGRHRRATPVAYVSANASLCASNNGQQNRVQATKKACICYFTRVTQGSEILILQNCRFF
jgi:hypothetical protein